MHAQEITFNEHLLQSDSSDGLERELTHPDWDQDNQPEQIHTNDSYLDIFMQANLNENDVIDETPMHEQTVTSLLKEYDDFNTIMQTMDLNSKSENVILSNSPILIKPIIEFMFKPIKGTNLESMASKEETKDQYHFQSNANLKWNYGYFNNGLSMLLSINNEANNLIYNQDHIMVYWKFIDFGILTNDPEVQFLQSLVEKSVDENDVYHYASSSICNLICFSSVKWSFEYVKDILSDPNNE